ncbi:MAG: hypothetical protein GEV06_07995 [Luteitalea sp.]|nr:hypothetical protein [Luteitalea sp.]
MPVRLQRLRSRQSRSVSRWASQRARDESHVVDIAHLGEAVRQPACEEAFVPTAGGTHVVPGSPRGELRGGHALAAGHTAPQDVRSVSSTVGGHTSRTDTRADP